MRPVTTPLLYFDRALFSYMERTLEDFKSFAFIAKEMNLLPQLYQRYLASSETVTLALPSENYHRSFSHGLLMFVSDYYQALQRNIMPCRDCYFCSGVHNRRQFCLPISACSVKALELFFDLLEFRRTRLTFRDDLVVFVRLCGYLLIKENVLLAFLRFCLRRGLVAESPSGPSLLRELRQNGFILTANLYASSPAQEPCYDVLQRCPSYRCLPVSSFGLGRISGPFSVYRHAYRFNKERFEWEIVVEEIADQ